MNFTVQTASSNEQHQGHGLVPIPIADTGTATFLPEDKAMMFMRYIRKHLDVINKSKEQNESAN
jgi:hypothetical protein